VNHVPPTRTRPASVAAALALLLALLLAPGATRAQPPDSVRTPPITIDTTRVAPAARAAVQRPKPPISPRAAFLSSLLVPGYGQSRLDRPMAASLFFAIELFGVALARKSANDLHVAERFENDSIVVAIPIDPSTGLPRPVREPGPFDTDRVRARRQHYEDWLAVIAFNHLFAGADAFVAANLWDLPTQISAWPSDRGPTIALSLKW
jgi:hypothetical protein